MLMKLAMTILLLLLTGCSLSTDTLPNATSTSLPSTLSPTQTPTRATDSSIPSVTQTKSIATTPTKSTPILPTDTSKPPPSSTLVAQSAPNPTPTLPKNWQTYISPTLRIAVDYPADWVLRETTSGLVFASPQGETIGLAAIDTGNLSPDEFVSETMIPNTRCSSGPNNHGLMARTCLDTISSAYTAYIILKSPNRADRLVALTTRGRGNPQVLNAMVASVRLIP
jgi:hypothetical protein